MVISCSDWLNAYGTPTMDTNGIVTVNLKEKEWLSCFINKYISMEKSKSKIGCQELVKDGTFSTILSIYTDSNLYNSINLDVLYKKTIEVCKNYNIRKVLVGQSSFGFGQSYNNGNISKMVSENIYLFKDLEFVKCLKPCFAEVSNNCNFSEQSEKWLPFMIVKNL